MVRWHLLLDGRDLCPDGAPRSDKEGSHRALAAVTITYRGQHKKVGPANLGRCPVGEGGAHQSVAKRYGPQPVRVDTGEPPGLTASSITGTLVK